MKNEVYINNALLFSFDDMSKTAWHYIPNSMFQRAGIPLKEIDSNQKELLNELLQSFLLLPVVSVVTLLLLLLLKKLKVKERGVGGGGC